MMFGSKISCCLLLACKFTKNIRKSARNCQLLPVFMANLLSFAYGKHKISSLDLE